MTIASQFGNVGARGALIRARAASLGAERHAIVRGARAAGELWGGAGPVATSS